jgi:hypothetical protein
MSPLSESDHPGQVWRLDADKGHVIWPSPADGTVTITPALSARADEVIE